MPKISLEEWAKKYGPLTLKPVMRGKRKGFWIKLEQDIVKAIKRMQRDETNG